jgi:CheY-like chemotaxis protein
MSRMLQRFGHDVSQAENGSIALDMLRERHFKNEQQFDILFLDKYVSLNDVYPCAISLIQLLLTAKCRSCLEWRQLANCEGLTVPSSLLVQRVMH